MSKERPKSPGRTTDNPARGRKGRGASYPNRETVTHHRCEFCGKRRRDGYLKVPRIKYGVSEGAAAHPVCGGKARGIPTPREAFA
jgi:hypothetical protein